MRDRTQSFSKRRNVVGDSLLEGEIAERDWRGFLARMAKILAVEFAQVAKVAIGRVGAEGTWRLASASGAPPTNCRI